VVVEVSSSRTELRLPSHKYTVKSRKKALNHIHPRTGSQGKMHVQAFMCFRPRLHVWMLVICVVVDCQVQLKGQSTNAWSGGTR
jgi:hypothetical protein